MDHERADALMREQFSTGPLAPHQHQALRIHLRQCDACRARYDQLARIETSLEGGDPAPAAVVDRMLAAGPPPPAEAETEAPRRRFLVLAPLLAAAAAMLLFFVPPTHDEIGIRGGPGEGKVAWVEVFVARGDAVTRLPDAIDGGDELLFAYTNLKQSPYRALAIAGLDAAGHAHWYHPAYTSVAEAPVSLAVTPGRADVELATRVRARHAPGPLRICAMFTTRPQQIKQVDAALEGEGRWPADAHLDCYDVEVRE